MLQEEARCGSAATVRGRETVPCIKLSPPCVGNPTAPISSSPKTEPKPFLEYLWEPEHNPKTPSNN
jgi:hypothetical protein